MAVTPTFYFIISMKKISSVTEKNISTNLWLLFWQMKKRSINTAERDITRPNTPVKTVKYNLMTSLVFYFLVCRDTACSQASSRNHQLLKVNNGGERAIIARPSLQTAANCSVRTWSLLNITKYYKMDWFITLELSGTDKKKRNVEIILLLRIMTNMSKDARRKEPIGKTYT